jgi:hypothetical protein
VLIRPFDYWRRSSSAFIIDGDGLELKKLYGRLSESSHCALAQSGQRNEYKWPNYDISICCG